MRLDEVTPEMVVEAARNIQRKQGRSVMTAKDIWYEICGIDMHSKYQSGNARVIANLIRLSSAKKHLVRDKTWTGVAHYRLKEE